MNRCESNTPGRSALTAMLMLLFCAATAQAQQTAPARAGDPVSPSQPRATDPAPPPPSTLTAPTGAVFGTTPLSTIAGVHGENTSGIGATATGVRGSTESASIGSGAASGVTGVLGVVIPTTPGGYSAGVRGVNNGTGGSGIGVVGFQGGSGWGVLGQTPSGLGVYGVTTSATGAGTGVYGESFASGGTGVFARYAGSGTGNALEVNNGAIKVSGTNKAAFRHTATAGNTGSGFTILDNPMINGDENAIIIVTPVSIGISPSVNFPVGLSYFAPTWYIVNLTGSTFPLLTQFNLLVIKQ